MTVLELVKRCQEYANAGQVGHAVALCDAVLETAGRGRLRAAALRMRAAMLLGSTKGWVPKAVGHLWAALELAQRYPEDQAAIFTTLAAAYSMHGAVEKAQKVADRYFELATQHPTDKVRAFTPQVWYNLGVAHDTAGNSQDAARCYQNAIDTAALDDRFNSVLPANNLVQMYLELGRVEEALEVLEQIKSYLDYPWAYFQIKEQEAQCLLMCGLLTEARLALEAVLGKEECPADVRAEALFTSARIHQVSGDAAAAKTLLEKATELAILLPSPRLIHRIEGLMKTLL